MINFNNLKVEEFYSYRTAIVTGVCIEEIKNSSFNTPTLTDTVREFLEDNGYTLTNHICFTTNNGLAFMYSGRCLYIGTKVTKRNW